MYDGRVVYYHGGEQTYAGVSLHGEAGRTNMKQRKRLHLHWQNVGLVIMENQKFSISAGLTCPTLHLDKDQLLGGDNTPRQRDNSGKLNLNQTYWSQWFNLRKFVSSWDSRGRSRLPDFRCLSSAPRLCMFNQFNQAYWPLTCALNSPFLCSGEAST